MYAIAWATVLTWVVGALVHTLYVTNVIESSTVTLWLGFYNVKPELNSFALIYLILMLLPLLAVIKKTRTNDTELIKENTKLKLNFQLLLIIPNIITIFWFMTEYKNFPLLFSGTITTYQLADLLQNEQFSGQRLIQAISLVTFYLSMRAYNQDRKIIYLALLILALINIILTIAVFSQRIIFVILCFMILQLLADNRVLKLIHLLLSVIMVFIIWSLQEFLAHMDKEESFRFFETIYFAFHKVLFYFVNNFHNYIVNFEFAMNELRPPLLWTINMSPVHRLLDNELLFEIGMITKTMGGGTPTIFGLLAVDYHIVSIPLNIMLILGLHSLWKKRKSSIVHETLGYYLISCYAVGLHTPFIFHEITYFVILYLLILSITIKRYV